MQDSLPAVAPTVFISYSHDSQEHLDRVLTFANHLRQNGLDATVDQYEVSPPEGWPVWMERQVRESDFVLVVCTETYLKRAERREEPSKGRGVIWESVLTFQQIYDAGSKNEKFIPVLLEGSSRSDIPVPLKSATSYECSTEQGYWELYARLTGQHGKAKPDLGKLESLPIREKKEQITTPATTVQPIVTQPAKVPALWNVPHDRNLVFTGRSEILESLLRDLAENNRQALYGLGGIGKTQIAVEYAYSHQSDYTAVLWAFADSEQSLGTSFIQIAKAVKLPVQDYPDQAVIVSAVKRWLEQNDGWLLVLDNVDRPEMLRPFLPQPGHGHVLMTSRAHDFQALSIFKPLEIIELSPEAAREFLLKRTGRDAGSADKAEIDSLTRELGYFPLALEQAGAFIHENQTSFDDYLKSFRKRRIALLEQHGPVMGGYKGTVATTWAINFAEVEKNPSSADLLRLSAFLAPILIPFELLERGNAELGETLASKLEGVADDPVLLGNILTPLTNYSLIRRNNATRSYSIHPLVQEVVRANMSLEVQRSWAERSVRALSAAFPDPEEFKNWADCERLLSHALLCAKYITDYNLKSGSAATLLRNAGYYLYYRGQFRQADHFLDNALKMREEVCGAEHPDTADSLSKVALLYTVQGKYPAAEALEQRALTIREHLLGAEHSDTATSVHNLAGIFRSQAKYVEAELLYQRALEIKEKILGPEHRETLINLSNMALLYTLQGRYAEAELLHKKVLAIREKSLGLDHPEIAMSLGNLAYHYHTQKRYHEAEVLNKRALAIQERWLGQEHPATATCLHNVAWLYHYQGKLKEAEALSRRVLGIREKIFGPEHPDVAESLQRLASVLETERSTEEAERLEQRALKILERALGDHPDTASTLVSLANLYLTQGRYRQAEPLFLRSFTIREKTLGSAHPDTLISLSRLAFLYRKWGRPRDAVKYERQLKQLQKKKRK